MLMATHLIGFGGKRAAAASGSATVWSATNKASGVTLSGGNLTATGPASFGGYADTSTTSKTYFEVVFTNLGSIPRIGVCTSSWTFSSQELGDANSISYNPSNGQVRYAGGGIATIMTATTTDRICVAWDHTNSKIYFRKNNGSWNNTTDDPASNTGGYSNFVPGAAVFPGYEVFGSTASVTAYFSSSSWSHVAPPGFSAMP